MNNALTIDVEDWYHAHDLKIPYENWDKLTDRIEIGTRKILELLDFHQTKATFFVLGSLAAKHPVLIREIASRGHEIGSHGNLHRMVSAMTPQEFRDHAAYTKNILEEICGCAVKSYRAPTWSISRESLWALEILEELGFSIDSSLQPFRTPLSGFAGAPMQPFYPQVNGKRLSLLEFPPSTLNFGRLIFPFAGGLYLRVLPSCLISCLLKQYNKSGPGLIYTHPWEVDEGQPRLEVSPLARFTHYYNLHTTYAKLSRLLAEFSFVPLEEAVQNNSFPEIAL